MKKKKFIIGESLKYGDFVSVGLDGKLYKCSKELFVFQKYVKKVFNLYTCTTVWPPNLGLTEPVWPVNHEVKMTGDDNE